MPLQIRRGTKAEFDLLAVPLAEGELLFLTDDQRLYIGAKDTLGQPVLGGVQITGYRDEDAQDAAAAMITGGVHSVINFSYNDLSNRLDSSINLALYNGSITATTVTADSITAGVLKGTIVADDSTILVDAVDGVLRGSLIGSVTGNVVGNVTGNIVGNVVGNVTGDIVGNSTGYHVGDTTGSVFGDDSTMMVNAVDLTLSNGNITIRNNSIEAVSGILKFGDLDRELNETVFTSRVVSYNSINADGSITGGGIVRNNTSRGTLSAPTAVQVGDYLSGYAMTAYDGLSFVTAGLVLAQTEAVTGTDPLPCKTLLAARGYDGGFASASIDSRGVFASSVFRAVPLADATERDTLLPNGIVEAGMVIFLTSTSKLQINTDSSTSGWIDLH
jgi:hypothetical protein